MAYSVKDGSQGQKNISDSAKPPSKTLIIPAKDLVQVIAKVQQISGLAIFFSRFHIWIPTLNFAR